VAQRPLLGALAIVWPFEAPQVPATGAAGLAEQFALLPVGVPVPLHGHDQGPVPLTAEGLP